MRRAKVSFGEKCNKPSCRNATKRSKGWCLQIDALVDNAQAGIPEK